MSNDDISVYRAFLDVRAAAEYLLIAHNAENPLREYHVQWATRELAKAADRLGFDLVKRKPVKTEEAA